MSLLDIPESDRNSTVLKLLEIIRSQSAEIEKLKEELARLKNRPTKPKLRPGKIGKSEQKLSSNKQKPKSDNNSENGSADDLTLVYGSTTTEQSTIRSATDVAQGDSSHILNSLAPNADATGFRLPSEAEWELAARFIADSNDNGDIKDTGEYYPGNYASGAAAAHTDTAATNAVAWYVSNSSANTHAVGTRTSNALGLFDMSGNVWEWNFDWYTPDTYRVRRGGGWDSVAGILRVGDRFNENPTRDYPAGASAFH